MPPRKGGTRRGASSRGHSVARKSTVDSQRTASQIYSDLLDEVAVEAAHDASSERPLKKRRTIHGAGAERKNSSPARSEASSLFEESYAKSNPKQTVYDDSASDSENSDLDWQDVDLCKDVLEADETQDGLEGAVAASEAANQDISVVLDEHPPKSHATPRAQQKRRLPTSTVEKKRRLDTHKIHFLCLLSHVSLRNAWCSDTQVISTLRKLLNKRTISYLNPSVTDSQFQRSRVFNEGLEQAAQTFRAAWVTHRRPMKRAAWVEPGTDLGKLAQPNDMDELHDLGEFRKMAAERAGSRDAGAQLFCALLRSAGVNARLVCSLQALPFASPPVSSNTPQKTQKETIIWPDHASEHAVVDESPLSASSPSPSIGPTRIKRFNPTSSHRASSPATQSTARAPPPTRPTPKTFPTSSYPIYWTEVFDPAYQRYIPVDALATLTINKPTKLEPPLSDTLNMLSYAVAFNADGSAKDVTRRYARAYNAKTRRQRVEASKNGQRWLKRAMGVFRPSISDVNAIEDAELAAKAAREPLPRNVADFKDHPVFALERHLKRHEVIWPRKEVGKVSVGKASLETVFRRSDVKAVKSAAKWYREGREVKSGEQPLKYASSTSRARQRNRRALSQESDHQSDADDRGVALYAEHQTLLYVPPPVVRGRLPKNAFGNLDLYVPSMIPSGGVHIAAPEAAKAARTVGVDYADAIVGFEFKGRQGTAVNNGIAVAKEYADAVAEVVRAMRWEVELKERQKKEKVALRMWKRFMIALQIRSRIMDQDAEEVDTIKRIDEIEDEAMRQEAEGGFLPGESPEAAVQPITHQMEYTTTEGVSLDLAEEVEPASRVGFDMSYHVPCIASPWDIEDTAGNRSAAVEPKPEASNIEDLFENAVESVEDIGGGFFPEDDSGATEPYMSTKDIGGGGFIVEDTLDVDERASSMQPGLAHEMNQHNENDSHLDSARNSSPPKQPEKLNSSASPSELSHEVRNSRQGATEKLQRTSMSTNQVEKEDDDDDADGGSLMSHDPEDEEAEPDWLAEDTTLLT